MHARVHPTHPAAIDAELTALARREGALEEELGRCLLKALAARVHEHLGMASFVEYASRRLGYSPRLTKEKLRVARALATLPQLERALTEGTHSFSTAKELTRIVTRKTEAEWLAATQGKTQREVERMVSGLRPGARPQDPRDPLLQRRRVVLDLPPETYALLRDAFAQVREVHGPATTDAELTRIIAETILGHAKPPEKPSYQIAVALCADCQRTLHHAGGETIEVDPAIGACATCDGEVVGLTDFDAFGAEAGSSPPPGLKGTFVHGAEAQGALAATARPRAELAPDSESTLTHVGRDPRPPASDPEAASIRALLRRGGIRAVLHQTSAALGLQLKTVTPKLRALVLARDHHRCIVPRCEHRAFTQLHHLDPQARGGPHAPDNLVSLCSQHHQRLHEGLLPIERKGERLEIRTGHGGKMIRHAPRRT